MPTKTKTKEKGSEATKPNKSAAKGQTEDKISAKDAKNVKAQKK